jgi:hypothetical protein
VPDHPDREQLAAYQAGDGDRRRRTDVAAHLAGCASCTEVVASVERARGRLALLEEPDLPHGLHDRLAAAVDGELAQPAGDQPRSRSGGPAPQERRRPAPWYRRPVAWGAAAALLVAALVVPFLDRGDELATAGGAGGGEAAREDATTSLAGGGGLPVIRIPGEVSAATVRSRLDADTQARAALDAAGARTAVRRDQAAPPSAQAPGQAATDGDRSSTLAPQAGAAGLGSCPRTATAAADPATRPLAPAFYVEGTYQGREATILVTTSAGQPGRVDLWVFPRGNCSAPPLASERVR